MRIVIIVIGVISLLVLFYLCSALLKGDDQA